MRTTQKQLRGFIREELIMERHGVVGRNISRSHRLVEKIFNPIMNRIRDIALSQGVDFENAPAHVKKNLETAVLNALREAVPEAITRRE